MDYISPIKIYYGNKIPYENIELTDEYYEVLDEMIKYDDLLIKKLSKSKENSELYDKFKNCREKLAYIELECNYRDGFKFGMRLGIDILK